MPSPNDPRVISALSRALGWSPADVVALPDYLRAFCFELLNYDGPEAGQ
jgi:hypothetical protein